MSDHLLRMSKKVQNCLLFSTFQQQKTSCLLLIILCFSAIIQRLDFHMYHHNERSTLCLTTVIQSKNSQIQNFKVFQSFPDLIFFSFDMPEFSLYCTMMMYYVAGSQVKKNVLMVHSTCAPIRVCLCVCVCTEKSKTNGW